MAHPIESIMGTTMENLREMVDVNTVVGDAVQTPDGSTIIPISKVSFGFVAGGGEYETSPKPQPPALSSGVLPFAGGTGAGVSVCPLGFLIVGKGQVKMLPAQHGDLHRPPGGAGPRAAGGCQAPVHGRRGGTRAAGQYCQDPTTPPNPF